MKSMRAGHVASYSDIRPCQGQGRSDRWGVCQSQQAWLPHQPKGQGLGVRSKARGRPWLFISYPGGGMTTERSVSRSTGSAVSRITVELSVGKTRFSAWEPTPAGWALVPWSSRRAAVWHGFERQAAHALALCSKHRHGITQKANPDKAVAFHGL